MTREYFQIEDDVEFPGRWHLGWLYDGDGRQIDDREFTFGKRIDISSPLRLSLADEDTIVEVVPPLRISLQYDGVALGFTFAGIGMPVLSAAAAEALGRIAGECVQRFPVNVDNYGLGFEIMNVASTVDCIDVTRSRIEWYQRDDKVRPDLAGEPKMISRLVIDSRRARGQHILRPKGWDVVIVVSADVKTALELLGVTGVLYREVTGPALRDEKE